MKRTMFYILMCGLIAMFHATASYAGGLVDDEDITLTEVERENPWTGFHIDLLTGGQFSNTEVGIESFKFDGIGSDGIFGCVRGGYDYVLPRQDRIILGIAVEGCLSNVETEFSGMGTTLTVEEDYSAAVTGRVGFLLWQHTAAFVRGGWRHSEVSLPMGAPDLSFDGFVVGAEIESFVAPNFVVHAGFDYTNYGDENLNVGEDHTIGFEREELRGLVGVGYRF